MEPRDEELLKTSRFRVVLHTYSTPQGETVVRESVQHPGAVTIIPLVGKDQVCLIRNYRVAIGQTLVELPAGTLDRNEDPATTARRELIEETGFRCQELRKIHEFFMSPGILNERMHLFVASGLTAGAAEQENYEQISNLIIPWTTALAMAEAGEIQDAKTLAALFFYDRVRARE